jgi:HAD superfamily hydrolase (TIGR01450 family)
MNDTRARLDAAAACDRYEAIRDRLPVASFPAASWEAADLDGIAGEVDVFVLDGFGVLNVGEAPVPGAPERMAALRAMGKRLIVLTNSATQPGRETVTKYAKLGMDFALEDIVSSRDALVAAMAARSDNLHWGVACTAQSEIEELSRSAEPLLDDPDAYERAEGFVLLSGNDWTPARQSMLAESLRRRPRPVLCGNPDLVAPRETGLTLEPGFHAHALHDATGVAPVFYGKPFADAFALAAARIDPRIPPQRIAMVGDTLHTDILGGAAQGWRTVLVRSHGLLKDLDHRALIRRTGIVPDFIVETT